MDASLFISYSRQNEKQALHLLGVLRREGFTVWIDQESIAGASIWSNEIVENIKKSDIFIILLSDSSAQSPNVSKEIALAAEHRKIILPIEIGTVSLPGQLEYALAGIQRTSYSDEEAILHAVRSQFARLSNSEATEEFTHRAPAVRKQQLRKKIALMATAAILLLAGLFVAFRPSNEKQSLNQSVMVLPFSTLNLEKDSTKNLDVFSESIQSKISKLNTLTVISGAVSTGFKNSQLNPMAIAEKQNVRFIIDGVVRKDHDQIFVTTRIFDAFKGGEIWERSYNSNTRELMSIQELVSNEVYGNLNAIVGAERELAEMEVTLKNKPNDAASYGNLATKLIAVDKMRALSLFEQAIKLDSQNIGYLMGAGITATRLKEESLAKDFGNLALVVINKNRKVYPDSLPLTTNYAVALDMAGEGVAAARVFDSLIKLYPTNIRILYNGACCYAKQGNSDRSVDILESLFPVAPGKRNEVFSDPDFDNIRSTPRYIKLMYSKR